MENLWMNLAKLRSQRKESVCAECRVDDCGFTMLTCCKRQFLAHLWHSSWDKTMAKCWTTLEKMRFYQIYIKLLLRHLPVVVQLLRLHLRLAVSLLDIQKICKLLELSFEGRKIWGMNEIFMQKRILIRQKIVEQLRVLWTASVAFLRWMRARKMSMNTT